MRRFAVNVEQRDLAHVRDDGSAVRGGDRPLRELLAFRRHREQVGFPVTGDLFGRPGLACGAADHAFAGQSVHRLGGLVPHDEAEVVVDRFEVYRHGNVLDDVVEQLRRLAQRLLALLPLRDQRIEVARQVADLVWSILQCRGDDAGAAAQPLHVVVQPQ